MTFTATGKAPGVYIDEVQLPGPIAGVGTSTAAFVGPARAGPTTPVFLTSFTQFVEQFGGGDKQGPFFTSPVFVTHAVKGFFDNGGSACFFVRVATAQRASLVLNDEAGAPTLTVTAKKEGVAGNDITVEIAPASIASTTAARAATTTSAPTGTNTATVADAKDFKPGDKVLIKEGAKANQAQIARIDGKTLSFETNLTDAFAANATIEVADIAPGERVIRVVDITGIEPGSYVVIKQDANEDDAVVASVEGKNGVITLQKGVSTTFTQAAADPPVTVVTKEFNLVVGGDQTYPKLSLDPRHSAYVKKAVQSSFVDVTRPENPPNSTAPPANLPKTLAATKLGTGTAGAEDDIDKLTTNHFKAGIDLLRKVDNVNLLCVPDRPDQDIQAYMITHCEDMADRFAILDPDFNATPAEVKVQRGGDPAAGNPGLTSDRGFAALYYPRIVISNPIAEGRLTVPPSGHVAGLCARTDNDRGVHKAPANAVLNGVLGLERTLTDEDQGPLNDVGINAIRTFPGRGIRVWGARTIATETQWRYVNVRRLLLFIEESIQEGTQFVVFEPNERGLWGRVNRQVTEFLTRVWSTGALFGSKASEAFTVRIDDELNPPGVRALGQLVIEIKLFPTTPAEFVVFRIIQQPGGPVVEE